jgi:hypothetical protein
MRACTLLTAGIVCSLVASAATQGDARFRARSDLVVLNVAVTDARGGFVGGLPASAFQVLEGGRPQMVSSSESKTRRPASDCSSTPAAACSKARID